MNFKVIVRVVKSLNDGCSNFGSEEAFRIPVIEAENKEEVKHFLLKEFPQFFPKGKVYQRETKDQAQFFYTLIYPLYKYENELIEEGTWECSYCGEIHENKYVSKPVMSLRLFWR